MAKFLFQDNRPDNNDNVKFKRRTVAGIPKMNFHVWAVPRDAVLNAPAPMAMWRYIGGFTDLSGLDVTTEVTEVTNSDGGSQTKKGVGKNTYGDITLNRGFDNDGFMQMWSNQIQSDDGKSERFMLDVVILKLTHDLSRIARVILVRNAWVSKYTPGDMDTTTTDPWVESVTLTNDSWAFGSLSAVEADIYSTGNEINEATSYSLGSDPSLAFVTRPVTEYYLSSVFVPGYRIVNTAGVISYVLRDYNTYFTTPYYEG